MIKKMDKIEWVDYTNCKVISMLDKYLDKVDKLNDEERSIIMKILTLLYTTYIYTPLEKEMK